MQTVRGVTLRIARSARNPHDFGRVSFSSGERSRANPKDEKSTRVDAAGRREPPQPRGLPLVGTMLSLAMAGGAQRLHEYVDERHRQLGPIYRERIGPVRAVFVNSPDEFRRIFGLEGATPRHFLPEAWMLYNDIRRQRRGLLFMDGDEWLHYRRILNKVLLLPNPAELMCAPCQEAAESLAERWKVQSSRGAVIENLEYQLYHWSIEAMMATLMGSRWQDCKLRMTAQFEYLALMLHRIFEYTATLSMVPAKLAMRLRLPAWTKFVETADAILSTVRDLVPEMTRLGGDGLLKLMMNHGIVDENAIRIVGDFIVAAGDTTAITMQWALLLLSGRLELQNQLFEDIKNLESLEEILRHYLLRGVMRETLRLHPVAPFLTRYLVADSSIGDYFVSKQDLLILSIYSSGRDVHHFPRPSEFEPERWIRTEEGNYRAVINPYATLPFAMGARSCIGRKLAETQLTLALAQLIRNFKIECENRNSIEMMLHLISVPSKPIRLKLTER